MKILKKSRHLSRAIAAFLAVIVFVLSFCTSSYADVYTVSGVSAPSIADIAGAGFMMEANTGTVLYDYNSDARMYPASTTKILTALLVIENCEDFNDVITFSDNAVNGISWDSSKIGASVGEQMTVDQVMYGLFIKSGNDCAVALAEYVAGSVDSFVEMMNERVQELGCTGSHFMNPHGLYDENHYTTAHDLALILNECVKHSEFLKYASANYYYVAPTNTNADGYMWYSKNSFLNDSYPDYDARVIASKTGFTDEAGNCLVTAAQVGDTILIMTALKCSGTHYETTKTMMNYGFDNFEVHNMSGDGTANQSGLDGLFGSWRKLLRSDTITLSTEDAYVLLPKGVDVSEVQTQIIPDTENSSDNIIANVIYSWNEQQVGEASIVLDVSGVGQAVADLENAQGRSVEYTESESGMETSSGHSGGVGVSPVLILVIVLLVIIIMVIIVLLLRKKRGGNDLTFGDKIDGSGPISGGHHQRGKAPARRDGSGSGRRRTNAGKNRRRTGGNDRANRRLSDEEYRKKSSSKQRTPNRPDVPEELRYSNIRNAEDGTPVSSRRGQVVDQITVSRANEMKKAPKRHAPRADGAGQLRDKDGKIINQSSDSKRDSGMNANGNNSGPGGSYENRIRSDRKNNTNTTSGLSAELINERLKQRRGENNKDN